MQRVPQNTQHLGRSGEWGQDMTGLGSTKSMVGSAQGRGGIFTLRSIQRRTDNCTEAATCPRKAGGTGQRGWQIIDISTACTSSPLVNMLSVNKQNIFHHKKFLELLVNVVD